MNIALVASHNGMGHSARLLRLQKLLQEMGHKVEVFLGPQQWRVLDLPSDVSSNVHVVSMLDSDWLDGPHVRTRRIQGLADSMNENLSELRLVDLVLSDNVTWPVDLNANTVLYSHFTWADYYSTKRLLVSESEVDRLSRIKLTISPKDFLISSKYIPRSRRLSIALPRFREFSALVSFRRRQQIWLCGGKTGSNFLQEKQINSLANISIPVRPFETIEMQRREMRPLAFFGRPGLGSITESLAAAVPFFPFYSGTDPELAQNSSNLKKLGFNDAYENLSGAQNIFELRDVLESGAQKALRYSLENMQPADSWAREILTSAIPLLG